MIVRISNERQYRLDDALHAQLNELDDAVVQAVGRDGVESLRSGERHLQHRPVVCDRERVCGPHASSAMVSASQPGWTPTGPPP